MTYCVSQPKFYCSSDLSFTDIFNICSGHHLVARYLRASLTVTKTHVDGQPAEVRGGRRNDCAQGVLLPPCHFHSPLPLLLGRSPGSQIFCVQHIQLRTHGLASVKVPCQDRPGEKKGVTRIKQNIHVLQTTMLSTYTKFGHGIT
jgi:hypothetical protein